MTHSNLIHHIVANIHNDAIDTEGLKFCCWELMQETSELWQVSCWARYGDYLVSVWRDMICGRHHVCSQKKKVARLCDACVYVIRSKKTIAFEVVQENFQC